MAQTNYTPIQLYYSTTAAAVPIAGNLASGELAINITDGKLYYKTSGGVVTLLAQSGAASPVTTFQTSMSGLTPATATSGAVTLAGTLGVPSGGTGLTTLAAGSLTYGAGTSAFTALAIGTAGQILTVNSGATAPQWSTLSGVAVTTFSAGTTGFTPSTATSGAITLAGTLATTNGGTGLTSFTSGGVVYASSTSALATGSALTYNGTGVLTIGTSLVYDAFINTPESMYFNFDSDNTSSSNFFAWGTDRTGSTGGTDLMRLNATGLGIGTTAPVTKLNLIDALSGGQLLVATNQTDATEKYGTFGTQHYTNAEEPALGMAVQSNATDNNILIGGALSEFNAATQVRFYTAANNTTVTGTERIRISSAGLVGVGTTGATSMLQTAGSSSVSALKTPNIAEVDTISATAATGTINYDITTQSVLFYTSNASANWTVNFRGSSGTSLNTLMQTGESISATFLVTQGATAYYNSAVTIDGTSVTPKWQGGTAPTSGNASSVDCYTYVIQKTGSATYVVLASQTKFA